MVFAILGRKDDRPNKEVIYENNNEIWVDNYLKLLNSLKGGLFTEEKLIEFICNFEVNNDVDPDYLSISQIKLDMSLDDLKKVELNEV